MTSEWQRFGHNKERYLRGRCTGYAWATITREGKWEVFDRETGIRFSGRDVSLTAARESVERLTASLEDDSA